ncbi:MAG TPA: HIT family protein [Ramlibacter sp.]|nr:HIT family protein [Ramlibacter sp.]
MKQQGCPLCDGPGGVPVFAGPKFRLIRADEAGFPAFYRLVWSEHVSEFSDLAPAQRQLCMEAVVQVEQSLRAHLHPIKVNLAALGNVVPHLHWHIVARFEWDSHFPGPVWAPPQREAASDRIAMIERLRPALEKDMVSKLAHGPGNPMSP